MDPMKFDLHRLRLLRELHYRETIAAVAAALNYSSASVSQQLSVLQREVGTQLLQPDGRGLRLTPQAHILVAHAERVFAQLEQAETDLAKAHEDIGGTVRIATFQTAALTLVPAALLSLQKSHPALRVEVVQASSQVARTGLLPRHFDLVIDEVFPGQQLARSDMLSQQLLFHDPMSLGVTSGAPTPKSLADYATFPWVMEPEASPARQWAVSVCRAAGFEPDVQFESRDVIVHERLAARGLAVSFLPYLLPAPEGGAVRSQLADDHSRRIVATTRTVANDHPAIVAVRNALRLAATP